MSNDRYVIWHGKRIKISTLDTGITRVRSFNQKDTFVKVPIQWAIAASKAANDPRFLVYLEILYRAWQEKGSKFVMPNGRLKENGVSREIKRRVLQDLEAAELIKVERKHGKSPKVKLLPV